MKNAIRFFLFGMINFIGMMIYLFFLPDMTFSSVNLQMEIEGISSKWFSLIDILLPLIILFIYFFETFYLLRREKMRGKPFQNRTVLEWSTMLIYLFTSIVAWLKMILQKEQYVGVGDTISIPVFYIVSAIIGSIFIIVGRLFLRAERGECLGIRLPFFTKDHSIWRRTNYLAGIFLFFSGILLIVGAILYETFQKDFLFYGTIGTVIFFSFLVPMGYCIFLNIKKKKNQPKNF